MRGRVTGVLPSLALLVVVVVVVVGVVSVGAQDFSVSRARFTPNAPPANDITCRSLTVVYSTASLTALPSPWLGVYIGVLERQTGSGDWLLDGTTVFNAWRSAAVNVDEAQQCARASCSSTGDALPTPRTLDLDNDARVNRTAFSVCTFATRAASGSDAEQSAPLSCTRVTCTPLAVSALTFPHAELAMTCDAALVAFTHETAAREAAAPWIGVYDGHIEFNEQRWQWVLDGDLPFVRWNTRALNSPTDQQCLRDTCSFGSQANVALDRHSPTTLSIDPFGTNEPPVNGTTTLTACVFTARREDFEEEFLQPVTCLTSQCEPALRLADADSTGNVAAPFSPTCDELSIDYDRSRVRAFDHGWLAVYAGDVRQYGSLQSVSDVGLLNNTFGWRHDATLRSQHCVYGDCAGSDGVDRSPVALPIAVPTTPAADTDEPAITGAVYSLCSFAERPSRSDDTASLPLDCVRRVCVPPLTSIEVRTVDDATSKALAYTPLVECSIDNAAVGVPRPAAGDAIGRAFIDRVRTDARLTCIVDGSAGHVPTTVTVRTPSLSDDADAALEPTLKRARVERGRGWYPFAQEIAGSGADERAGEVALASSGARMIIGAPGAGPFERGAVRVFELSGSETPSWVQLGTAFGAAGDRGRAGSAVAISRDGDVVVLGAPVDTPGRASRSGSASVWTFSRASNTWSQRGATLEGVGADDSFGERVALSGDGSLLVVSAPTFDFVDQGVARGRVGQVRFFDWNSADSAWRELGAGEEGSIAGDEFGFGLAVSEDGLRVAVGAPLHSAARAADGRVTVYSRSATGDVDFSRLGVPIDGENSFAEFGSSLSLSADGSLLAVGAPGERSPLDGASNAGAVHFFGYDSSARVFRRVAESLYGASVGDFFGSSLQLSTDGRRIAVGAFGHTGATTTTTTTSSSSNGADSDQPFVPGAPDAGERGHARVFELVGTPSASSGAALATWIEVGQNVDGDELFARAGMSVGLSGDGTTLAVGAPTNGDNVGHVRTWRTVQLAMGDVVVEMRMANYTLVVVDENTTDVVNECESDFANAALLDLPAGVVGPTLRCCASGPSASECTMTRYVGRYNDTDVAVAAVATEGSAHIAFVPLGPQLLCTLSHEVDTPLFAPLTLGPFDFSSAPLRLSVCLDSTMTPQPTPQTPEPTPQPPSPLITAQPTPATPATATTSGAGGAVRPSVATVMTAVATAMAATLAMVVWA